MINWIKKYFFTSKQDKSDKKSAFERLTNITDLNKSTKSLIPLSQILENKNADEVEDLMTYTYSNETDDKIIKIIHQLITEPWHRSYEEMAHYLQSKKKPESVEPIKRAMQKRYDYLESYGTGTRQFINQCGHALWSIGTNEAINSIRELTKSDDPIIRDEMLYRLSRIENRNNYERIHDLE